MICFLLVYDRENRTFNSTNIIIKNENSKYKNNYFLKNPFEAEVSDCYYAAVYANGETYVGQFKNNKKDGTGVYTWPAPAARKYEGTFREGVIYVESSEKDAPESENKQ